MGDKFSKDFNDFMMYKMVTESDNKENNNSSSSGNSGGCLYVFIIGLVIFKLFEWFCMLIY